MSDDQHREEQSQTEQSQTEQSQTEQSQTEQSIDLAAYRRRSRRSFLGFAAAGLVGFTGFRHVLGRRERENIPDVIRSGLEVNESVWDAIGSDSRTSPTYDITEREPLRVNGQHGLRSPLSADWGVRVVGPDGGVIERFGLDHVQSFEHHDMVWEHKCIEGWANIVHWTGARCSDVLGPYLGDAVPADVPYVSVRTPDNDYYVGLDLSTMMHSQALLAWALNGEPLTEGHGAPLRLAMPITYGIKQLKRVGTIEFTYERPADYWGDRGYDWHARF